MTSRGLPVVALLLLFGLAGCEGTAVIDPSQSPGGTYVGSWIVTIDNPTLGQSETVTCPGQLTLDLDRQGNVSGSYLLRASGDCADGTAVSGEVVDGSFRSADGGINFATNVPDSEDIIYSDMLENAFRSALFRGSCTVTSFDSHLTGSWEPSGIKVQGNATYQCTYTDTNGDQQTETVVVALVYEGSEQE